MDYEFNPGDIFTAVNRSSKTLNWTFNGKTYVLKPHEEKPMNAVYLFYGIRRHPVMGTFDPSSEHQHESLIGIKELQSQYPCEPKEQSKAVEAIDRSKLPLDRQQADLLRVGWDADMQRLAGRSELPDTGFTADK